MKVEAYKDRVILTSNSGHSVSLTEQKEVLTLMKDLLTAARAAFPGGVLSPILDIEHEVNTMLAERGETPGDRVTEREVERFIIPLVRANPEHAARMIASYLRES